MIESLAAGTPVIALRRGAVPEVLVDGVCAFVGGDVEAMVAAVARRLDELDPSACRERRPTSASPRCALAISEPTRRCSNGADRPTQPRSPSADAERRNREAFGMRCFLRLRTAPIGKGAGRCSALRLPPSETGTHVVVPCIRFRHFWVARTDA